MASDPVFALSLVVAIADNGVIGREGKLPWRLGSDLRRFRKLTMGHPLIMGRKTFESIGKPLDGRDSIVITASETRDGALGNPSVLFAHSVKNAIEIARECAKGRGVSEAFVIGGAGVFSEALPFASRLYLTRVHGVPEGDVHWDFSPGADWVEVSRAGRPASDRDEFPVTDHLFERLTPA